MLCIPLRCGSLPLNFKVQYVLEDTLNLKTPLTRLYNDIVLVKQLLCSCTLTILHLCQSGPQPNRAWFQRFQESTAGLHCLILPICVITLTSVS